MKPTRLRCVSKGHLWSNGAVAVAWSPVGLFRWSATWTDFMSVRHRIEAESRAELHRKLQPYGMGPYVLERK